MAGQAMASNSKIYTVGHSTLSLKQFSSLLLENHIAAVADVRSSPYSRYAPQFNTETLKKALNGAYISYVFLGKVFGARSDGNSCYVGNTVGYEKLAQTPLFQRRIQRLKDGCNRYNVALMCSERDPIECHRTILISKILSEKGFEVSHILGNRRLETHTETMLRVLDILKMPIENMLFLQEELIEHAHKKREKQIAYRREG